MIAQLHGILLEATISSAVVEASGIGFEAGISAATAAALPAIGEEVRLYTRMRIGSDAVALFGFATASERELFDKLVAVSGVGPRLALSVLSKYTARQIYTIMMAEDVKAMQSVPGVGKKTAQRLILELKSSFEKSGGMTLEDAPAAGRLPLMPPATSALDDARAALLSMGFTSQETDLALSGYEDQQLHVEELLSAALKRLGMEA